MKLKNTAFVVLIALCSCNNTSKSDYKTSQASNQEIANRFIDAFYSFNADSLTSILSCATESLSSTLYYQKWAECGNYSVIQRNDYIEKNDSLILCPITVKDDLIGSLKIDFNVTDTFHISIINGQIHSVVTSSNDPDIYYEAREWIMQNQPELISEPCEGIWEDGLTPCECVRAMVEGYKLFIDSLEK